MLLGEGTPYEKKVTNLHNRRHFCLPVAVDAEILDGGFQELRLVCFKLAYCVLAVLPTTNRRP